MEMDLGTLVLTTGLKIAGVIGIAVGAFAPVLVWAERRQSAMMQDRIGPNRAGIPLFGKNITLWGLLHPLADAVKMIWKEDFVPPRADKLLHALAPIISLIPAIAAFAIIPFASVFYPDYAGQVLPPEGVPSDAAAIPMQIASLNVGILFAFAIAGTGIIGAAIAGYASDNKYSLLGGLRAAGQLVSYEVTLGLTLVGSFMVYGSLRLEDMVLWQHGRFLEWIPRWGIFVQPLGFVLYMAAAIAETKRIPFDVPEGESEIVGGYFTEYSGMKWGMFMMGEFIEIVLLSAFAATIFLGGWDLPFLTAQGFDFFGATLALPHGAVITIQILGLLAKMVVLMGLQLQIRWTLPRFRYDQIMRLCWKYLLPLSLVNIALTGALILLLS